MHEDNIIEFGVVCSFGGGTCMISMVSVEIMATLF
jgi:hypothetical protein